MSLDGTTYTKASFVNIYAYLKDFLSLGTLGYTGFWLMVGAVFALCI